jgi:hypothetical protein
MDRIEIYRKSKSLFTGRPSGFGFYIHKGKVKVTVTSERGKEAISRMLAPRYGEEGEGATPDVFPIAQEPVARKDMAFGHWAAPTNRVRRPRTSDPRTSCRATQTASRL